MITSISNTKRTNIISSTSPLKRNYVALKGRYDNDTYISSSKKNVIIFDEIGTLINNNGIRLIKRDLQKAQGYKQKTKIYENGAKTITLHKGLGILPWSYRGELNYDKNGKLTSAVILGDKARNYGGEKCKKNIYIDQIQGIQILLEKDNTNHPLSESIYNLSGIIQREFFKDDNGNKINMYFDEGKLSIKETVFTDPNSAFSLIKTTYLKNGKPLTTYTYKPDSHGGVRTLVIDENDNLLRHSLKGFRTKDKIVNITEVHKNNRKTMYKEIINNDGSTDFKIVRGDLRIEFSKPQNENKDGTITVNLYKNDNYVGQRKLNKNRLMKNFAK